MDPDTIEYWCDYCNKRVSIENLADLPDVICQQCKIGFVESVVAANPPSQAMPFRALDRIDEPSFSNRFRQVLRRIKEDITPSTPSEHEDPSDDDNEGNEGEVRNEGEDEKEEENNQDRSDGENEDNGNRDERDEEDLLRRRRDVRLVRLMGLVPSLATRAPARRHRNLDWAEILMELEGHSIELPFQVSEEDDDVGNPEDYVEAAGYEALLQSLADSDDGGGRGAPPAAKSAVMALHTMEITSGNGSLVCAICKDSVNVGEIAKKMPCGHGYHEDCIVPWLGSRNSCPVCRFELETDDPDYEEERKKRATANLGSGPSSSAG